MKKFLLVFALLSSCTPAFAQEDEGFAFDIDGGWCDTESENYVEVGYEGMMWIASDMRYTPSGSFAILDEKKINKNITQYFVQDERNEKRSIYVDKTGYIFEGLNYVSGTAYREEGNVDVIHLMPCE